MKGNVQWKRKWGRGLAVFVLAVSLLFLSDYFAVVSSAASAAKVTAKGANIRKEPNASSTAVGSATKDTKVEILSQTTGADGKVWYQIQVNGNTTGYIRSDLVEITDGTVPPTEGAGTTTGENTGAGTAGTEAEQLVPVSATVSGSNTVRVRTSASTANSNNILTTVTKGTNVTVVARTTGEDGKLWYQIKFNADGKDVIGYIRNDYLTLSGEVTPLSETQVQPPEDPQPEEPDPEPVVPEQTKRYETKLINEKWYILDYEVGQQFEIDKLFVAADEYKALYEEALGKANGRTIWLFILGFAAVALMACSGYLLYRLKECKEEAFIASIENNTRNNRSRTAERPRSDSRDGKRPATGSRPVIREGMSSQKPEEQRRVQNGQKPAGGQPQNGQRPAGGQPQNGQRPAGGQPQNGQRPAGGQPQNGPRPVSGQPQNGQRPVSGQPQNGQRPAGGQPQNGQRPVKEQAPQRKVQADSTPKARNFAEEDDDVDFEVLNWDSDDM